MKKGLVQVYTGDGKGKTTCAFGQALRAVGRGLKVCIFQFLKDEKLGSGEVIAFEAFKDSVRIVRGCQTHPMLAKKEQPSLKEEILEMVAEVKQVLASGKYNMVVLDEINNCVDSGLLEVKRLVEIIKVKPARTELILTGRGAAREVVELADLVTNMSLVKHPFKAGVKARKGIEY